MRKIVFIAILHLCCHHLTAQVNYVLNPSLDQHNKCPHGPGQINYAINWNGIDTAYAIDTFGDPHCTPSYCNLCDTYSTAQLKMPQNSYFNRYPRTGTGMALANMFVDSTYTGDIEIRDYLQGKLRNQLTSGVSYCVTFYASLTQTGARYAVNHIGAFLDNGLIDTCISECGLPHMQFTPQIVTNNIIQDTTNWVKIEGSFIANGTEKFITIGNFYDMAHTAHVIFNPNFSVGIALYILDDISVIETGTPAFAWGTDTLHKGYMDSILLGRNETIPDVRWYRDGVLIDTLNAGIWCKDDTLGSYHTYIVSQALCGVTTYDTVVVSVELVTSGVKSTVHDNNLSIYPNPNKGTFTIQGNTNSVAATIEVTNAIGQIIFSKKTATSNGKLNDQITFKALAGLYFLRVITDEGNNTLRLLISQE